MIAAALSGVGPTALGGLHLTRLPCEGAKLYLPGLLWFKQHIMNCNLKLFHELKSSIKMLGGIICQVCARYCANLFAQQS